MGINANEQLAEKLVKILKEAVKKCLDENVKVLAKI